jgi:hypothetical protein
MEILLLRHLVGFSMSLFDSKIFLFHTKNIEQIIKSSEHGGDLLNKVLATG